MPETTMFSEIPKDRSQLPYDKYREEDRQLDGNLSNIGPIARGIADVAAGLASDDDGSVSPEQTQRMAEYIKSELSDLPQLGFNNDQIEQIREKIATHLKVIKPALSAPMVANSEEPDKERGRQVTESSRSAVQRTAERIAQIQESGQPDQLATLPSEQRLLNQQIALFLSTAQRYGTSLDEARQIMNATVNEAGVRRINQTTGDNEPIPSAATPDNSNTLNVPPIVEPDPAITPELDKPVNHEHILNAPSIRIVPDTHGLDPAFYGVDINSTNIVSVGDLIDAPKNIKVSAYSTDQYRAQLIKVNPNRPQAEIEEQVQQFERMNEAARQVDIKKSVEVWADLLESDRGQVVLGNHELMALSGLSGNDADLWQWITDSNKGGTTLEAFGISAPTVIYDKDSGFNPPVSQAECARIRQEVQNNPTLQKFFDQLKLKGKMYVIANEALIVHAGIPVGQNGELIPPQRAGKAFKGFESLTGLDAFEAIESELRKSPPNLELLHWLGNGSSKEMTPAWVREPFFDVMNDPQKAAKVREELRQQAQVRGGNINIIMIGHTEKVGGKRVGDVVFGTDTAVGDIVTLEREAQANNPNQDQVKMIAKHNFGSKTDQRPFGYNASKS